MTSASAGIRGTGSRALSPIIKAGTGTRYISTLSPSRTRTTTGQSGRAWNRPLLQSGHGSHAQPVLLLHRGPFRRRAVRRKPHSPGAREQGLGKAFLCRLQLDVQPRFGVHRRAVRRKRPGKRAGAGCRATRHSTPPSVTAGTGLPPCSRSKILRTRDIARYGVYSPYLNDIALYPSPGRQFFLTLRYTLGG